MRKKMIAMLFVLILTLSGCADVSTAPKESDNYELVTETEAAAETESTESSSFSESKESESAKTDTELERNAEVTEYELVESETSNQNEPVSQGKNQVSETKPAVTESSSAPVEKPEKTEPPAEIPPQSPKIQSLKPPMIMNLTLKRSRKIVSALVWIWGLP